MPDELSLDIANYIYEHPDELDLSLKGIWIADRKTSFSHL